MCSFCEWLCVCVCVCDLKLLSSYISVQICVHVMVTLAVVSCWGLPALAHMAGMRLQSIIFPRNVIATRLAHSIVIGKTLYPMPASLVLPGPSSIVTISNWNFIILWVVVDFSHWDWFCLCVCVHSSWPPKHTYICTSLSWNASEYWNSLLFIVCKCRVWQFAFNYELVIVHGDN